MLGKAGRVGEARVYLLFDFLDAQWDRPAESVSILILLANASLLP